ncbi:junctional sarcoplasmic reticulum protein 1 [Bos indicus]|uniref:Junctional sarcoplasmic reticulum protein 1 n=2 Tax=Bos TaxID=9903 RepID=A0A4W2HVU1_BOBOX|nr:junctional sarcoplasmic reticulum protein 1 [Bos indicus x Bos taurus]DAA27740.1 TPA: junctional sarcoplasmic reticulum protein 1 [Bos taurus]
MATRAMEELDGGLGSCQVDEDLSALADPCPSRPQEDSVRATSRLADSSSRSHDSQERVTEGSPTGSVDTKPKKMEKEPVSKVTSGAGKEKLKAGATPRSPARKKAQTASPPQPPPPPALSDELPWGDLTLNKCLVLASLVALLGSAFQLCREAVARDVEAPAPVPESWASSSSSPKGPASTLPKPEAWAPSVRQPEPPSKLEERVQIPRSEEAAEKDEWESEEAADGEHVPLAGRGPKEKLKKEKPRKERPGKEKPQKEERPRKEKPRKEEKPRGAREPQGALPRRWEAREGGHRPWGRDSGAPEDRKRQAWVSLRRPDEEDRPLGRQKRRAGKGRD